MVFYRKYRPQKINELDNPEIREKLTAVFSQESYPHAFLFTGPKGLGKTSAARIIAKVLNCERLENQRLAASIKDKKLNAKRYTLNASVEPCNKCEQCVSITNGSNMDILEIDAASNRGIDEIRDLREKIRLAPFKASKKVYIIDEVHMLTTEAFNALLKTLEEPPPHSVFILCTTEPQKVPATIFSRCFHLQFTLATEEELVRSFARIAKDENFDVDKEALKFIASLSDGSFRDGSKILEEIVMLAAGKKVTKEMVEEKYQISNLKYQIDQMFDFLSEKKTKEALELIQKLVEKGTDIKYLLEQMINELHLMLLVKIGIQKNLELRTYNLELSEIKSLAELLGKAYLDTKYAVLPQLPLELAMIEWCTARGPVADEVSVGNTPAGPAARQPQNLPTALTSAGPHFGAPRLASPADLSKSPPSVGKDLLLQLIEKVKPHNHSVAGVLRGCTLKEINDKKMVIEAKYKFHKERLEENKTKILLEKIVQEITGNKIIFSVVLK